MSHIESNPSEHRPTNIPIGYCDRRMDAYISDTVYQRLLEIAAKKEVTLDEVFRHALGLESWFFEATESSCKVCIERENNLYMVDFPWSR